MNRLLNLMAGWNTDQTEMVATLFAAWNDFLLGGVKPTDQQIIDEVRDNGHVNKQKLTPYRLKRMLNLMRREHLIPRGIGPKTMPSDEKSLWQSSNALRPPIFSPPPTVETTQW